MKKTFIFAACGLAASMALAQAAYAQAPAAGRAPAAQNSTAPGANSNIVDRQANDEWLASSLKGATVIGSDDMRIGAVSDMLVDNTGQVRALIVNIDGEPGPKAIAVNLTAFQQAKGIAGLGPELKLAMTRMQAAQAKPFRPLSYDAASGVKPGAAGNPGPSAPPPH
jgi:hypothetical protein